MWDGDSGTADRPPGGSSPAARSVPPRGAPNEDAPPLPFVQLSSAPNVPPSSVETQPPEPPRQALPPLPHASPEGTNPGLVLALCVVAFAVAMVAGTLWMG